MRKTILASIIIISMFSSVEANDFGGMFKKMKGNIEKIKKDVKKSIKKKKSKSKKKKKYKKRDK